MNEKYLLLGIEKASLYTQCLADDVLDNVIDLLSVIRSEKGIEVMALTSFVEVKPYIAMTVSLLDIQTEALQASISCNTKDANHLLFNDCFGFAAMRQDAKAFVKITVVWMDSFGNKKYAEKSILTDIANEPLTALQITEPRARDTNLTKVLYGTYTRGDVYDYTYPENKRVQNTVKAMLPIRGKLELDKNWHPVAIDMSEGNAAKLYMLLSTGGTVEYKKPLSDIFTLTENTISFALPDDDWGSVIDTSRLGSSVYFDIYFSFTVSLRNDYYPLQSYKARAVVICKPRLNEACISKVAMIEPIYLYWDCLAENTKIRMASGIDRCIDTIEEGDRIMAGNGESVCVTKCFQSCSNTCVQIVTEENTLIVSDQHMIQTNTGFIKACNLTNCGYLLENLGRIQSEVNIHEIKKIDYKHRLYHIEVDKIHTLIANGIVVGDGTIKEVNATTWSQEILDKRTALHNVLFKN